ncbi:MAG: hypothetical protein EZS28_043149 [Streblomastix strix]|uniref:Uncharacterized protein n=1 Tax=Streblomastix strix TaxID=222440 RepID=A0A5J4TSL8_9EUKA|nr:MAG: hypothetical protein EZS28_043149 [Streblomastix strix]
MDLLSQFIEKLPRVDSGNSERYAKEINELLKKKDKSFPGNHPVSIEKDNMCKVSVHNYGRKGEMMQVNITCHRIISQGVLQPSLIDGELILDKHPLNDNVTDENRTQVSDYEGLIPTYYAFDMMIDNGQILIEKIFDSRLGHLLKFTSNMELVQKRAMDNYRSKITQGKDVNYQINDKQSIDQF